MMNKIKIFTYCIGNLIYMYVNFIILYHVNTEEKDKNFIFTGLVLLVFLEILVDFILRIKNLLYVPICNMQGILKKEMIKICKSKQKYKNLLYLELINGDYDEKMIMRIIKNNKEISLETGLFNYIFSIVLIFLDFELALIVGVINFFRLIFDVIIKFDERKAFKELVKKYE